VGGGGRGKGETATGRESNVEGGAGGESCAKGGAYRERAAQTAAQRAVVHELLLHFIQNAVQLSWAQLGKG
jgi:hypothetical protein